jgi:hypothetical protein
VSRKITVVCFFLILTAWASSMRGGIEAQASQEQQTANEIVVNLATGRVIIAVWKDAILVGAVANPIEAGAHLPVPVQISDSHVAVLLGAVDWIDPDSRKQLARLDLELPHLRGHGPTGGPHLGSPEGMEAGDLEAVGDGLLERLNELARNFHSEIDAPGGLPLVQLIVAGYVPNYGPEVWRLDYGVHQSEEAVGYWSTRVNRPSYTQLYPPEKGEPHTLIEFSYPQDDAEQPLLELLRAGDARLRKVTAADGQMADVARAVVAGDTNKVKSADATQFFRATLEAVSPPNAQQSIGILREESGFKWVLEPPAEPKAPGIQSNRPRGAPTLRHPSE